MDAAGTVAVSDGRIVIVAIGAAAASTGRQRRAGEEDGEREPISQHGRILT
jgi:hypothetical protein